MKIVLRNTFFYFLAFILVLVLNHGLFFLMGMSSEFTFGKQDMMLLCFVASLSVILAFLVYVKKRQRK